MINLSNFQLLPSSKHLPSFFPTPPLRFGFGAGGIRPRTSGPLPLVPDYTGRKIQILEAPAGRFGLGLLAEDALLEEVLAGAGFDFRDGRGIFGIRLVYIFVEAKSGSRGGFWNVAARFWDNDGGRFGQEWSGGGFDLVLGFQHTSIEKLAKPQADKRDNAQKQQATDAALLRGAGARVASVRPSVLLVVVRVVGGAETSEK